MEKIKPCPCCGTHADIQTTDCDELGDCLFWIECFGCGIRTGIGDIDEVFQSWNQRVIQEA